MKQEDQIISKYGKDSGMKVPEGYFSELERNILVNLPSYPKKTLSVELSGWQKIKPYLYLAAMFCGIWLMMKVFHMATQPISLNLDNPPQALVEMIDGGYDYDTHYLPYMMDYDTDDEEFIMEYDNIEDFEKDFGYTLKPEYSSLPAEHQGTKNVKS